MADFIDRLGKDVTLRMALNLDEDALGPLLADVADSVIAVIHLAQTATDLWLSEHGAVEVESR